MTNLDILEANRELNEWLIDLTENQIYLILNMMDEARELGYDKGIKDAKN